MTDDERTLLGHLKFARQMVAVGTFIGTSVGIVGGLFWENKAHVLSKKPETETMKHDTSKHDKSFTQFTLDKLGLK